MGTSEDTSRSRRAVLAGIASAAALPVAAAIPTTLMAGPTVDPAFALIAEKLAADVAHCNAIDVQGEFDGRRDYSSDAAIEAQDNSEDACNVAHEADWKLATTRPTTLAGVAAVLRFANQIEDEGGEWPDTDAIGPEGWHYQLRATMAVAIEALAGKAVQS
jgi:acyl-CoA synthetase (NDP forming)